jgi:hypothetical protein
VILPAASSSATRCSSLRTTEGVRERGMPIP